MSGFVRHAKNIIYIRRQTEVLKKINRTYENLNKCGIQTQKDNKATFRNSETAVKNAF